MANLILWNCYNIDYAPVRPAGPHQLAHWLNIHGYNVKVIDFCHLMSADDLVNITLKHVGNDTIAIGVSTTFWHTENKALHKTEPDWVLNARQKLSNINVKWMLGGANSNGNFLLPWDILHGHAEDSLLKYMDENSSKSFLRPSFDITKLENCFYDDLAIQPDEVLPIELSRGCQFKCRFCRYPLLGKKKNTYIRDYKLIEQEFLENYHRYGVTKYFFLDDTVNESDEKVENLAEIAQRLPFKLSWFGYNRLDIIGVKPHTAELLKLSGLKSSFFGIESFHPQASKIVGKGWSGAKGKEFILNLREEWKSDINFTLAFIIGLTGETEQDIDATHQWCIDNDMPSWRFAGLHINAGDNQIWKSDFDLNYSLYGYKIPFPNNKEFWINKHWTSITARQKAKALTIDLQPRTKPAVWLLGELSTLGYDMSYLMQTYKKDIDWEDVRQRNKQFVNFYGSN
jgi:hypothetical protein